MKQTKIDEWREANGMTYAEMGKIMGTSRQYAFAVCQRGVVGVAKYLKLIALSKGTLTMEDILSDEDREMLVKEGFIKVTEDPQDDMDDVELIDVTI